MNDCGPLRGKVMYEMLVYSDNSNFGDRDTVIEQWKKFAKNVASAVKFYEIYADNKEALMSEETEAFLVWIHLHDEGDFKTQKELDDSYRKWLFKYSFEDLIK